MNSCGRCRLLIFEAVESDEASSRVCVHVTRVVGACAGSCDNMSAFEQGVSSLKQPDVPSAPRRGAWCEVFHTMGRLACLLASRTLPPYNNSKLVDFVEAAVLFQSSSSC